jgi:serine phosphatase RsbU (regulator of sigma subunit)/Tfp pilus assembly protein PilF
MPSRFLRILFLAAAFLLSLHSFSQDKVKLRANMQKLPSAIDDTNKVILLNSIAWDTSYENIPAGLKYSQEALALSEKLNYDQGRMVSWNIIGTIYDDQGEYEKAIDAHHKSLAISERTGKRYSQATSWMNIGNLHRTMGQTLECYQCLMRAITIYNEINSDKGRSGAYINLGSVYIDMDSLDQAILSFNKALDYARKMNKPYYEAHALSGMAGAVARKGDSVQARIDMYRAVAILDSMESYYDKTIALFDYAEILKRFHRYEEAERLFLWVQQELKRIGITDQEKEIWKSLADLYRETGRPEQALDAMKKYTHLKDSLIDEKVLRHQRDLEAVYENEKKENEIRRLTQAHQLQKTYLLGLIAGFVLLAFLLVMLYNRNALRKRVSQQLAQQLLVIEEKNKNITDSINYARKIQEAMLPSVGEASALAGETVVFYRPRDIVSGDFWWFAEKENRLYFAVVDCTGHGVPGGFMSVMGAAFLSEIVNEKGLSGPAEILAALREKVSGALSHAGDENKTMRDGMDIVLCAIDKHRHELHFACANRPLWLFRKGMLIESKTDPFPVGRSAASDRSFTPQQLSLQRGDMIYLFTDGYADQLGGTEGQKFGEQQLRSFLSSISGLPAAEQEQRIAQQFSQWKDILAQTDDICLLGIRV